MRILHRSLLLLTFAMGTQSEWAKVDTENSPAQPKPSMAHVAGAFRSPSGESEVVVFGGCTSSCCFAPIDSLWSLSLSSDGGSGQWTELHPSPRPPARFSAASSVVKDTLYVFGGQDSSQAFLSDLWAYDQPSREWRALQPSGLEKEKGRTAAPHPPARAGHSLSPIDDTHLLLSGGFGQQGVLGDLWVLELQSLRWTPLAQTAGAHGVPRRSGHVAVAHTGAPNVVTLFGGYDESGVERSEIFAIAVDVHKGAAQWAQVDAHGTPPSPRHGAAALYPSLSSATNENATFSSSSLSGFRVFGGLSTVGDTLPSSFLSDGGAYDAATQVWAPLAEKEEGAGVGPRAYASVAHLPDASLVFGGFAGYTGDTDDRLLSDVWIYRTPTSTDGKKADATKAATATARALRR